MKCTALAVALRFFKGSFFATRLATAMRSARDLSLKGLGFRV